MVGLHPSIQDSADLNSLKKAFENKINKQIPTSNLVKMADIVLSNYYVEFSENFFQQISETAIGTNSVLQMYISIWMK